jgi:hypothetical protein
MNFLSILLQVDINDKLKNAPDSGYQTGLIIGSFLPFVLLVGIAYYMYYRSKNRKDLD